MSYCFAGQHLVETPSDVRPNAQERSVFSMLELPKELLDATLCFVSVPDLVRCTLVENASFGRAARARLMVILSELKDAMHIKDFEQAQNIKRISSKSNRIKDFFKFCASAQTGVFSTLAAMQINDYEVSLGAASAFFTCVSRSLTHLPCLFSLDFYFCDLASHDMRRFSSSLGAGTLPCLSSLSFRMCPFRGDDFRVLIEALFGNRDVRPTIYNFEVIAGGLDDRDMRAFEVVTGRERPCALGHLAFSRNVIGPEGIGHMITSMRRGSFPNLKYFRLTDNCVGNEGLQKLLFPILDESMALEHLFLTANRIEDDGMIEFCRDVLGAQATSTSSLKFIDFRNNPLGILGKEAFKALIAKGALPSLTNFLL
jgi:hypothetical protein